MTTETDYRKKLEEKYGVDNVWNTDEATKEFDFTGFSAPFVVVQRKSDDVKGTLVFSHSPRFYFNFIEN